MSETLVKWRLFFVWQEDKEEKWLEEMARQGWHLVKGGLRFVFKRGEPTEMRYRLDWRQTFPAGKDEYFAVFRDAGWEWVDDFKHWHYFRSPAVAGAPDIYTDIESRVEMYGKLQRLLYLVLFLNLALLRPETRPFRTWILPLQLLVIALLGYGLLRLHLKKKQLRATGAS